MASDTELLQTLVRELGLALALSVVAVAALVVLAWTWLKGIIERHAGSAIERRLDGHRQQLQLSADSVRLDFQRRMADFAVYNMHRHQAYRSLFRRALKAEGALSGLFGLTMSHDYSDATAEEIAKLLRARGVPGRTRDAILAAWDEKPKSATQQLQSALRQCRESEAQQAFQAFKNAFLLSELYISQPVRDALHNLNGILASLSAYVAVPADSGMKALQLKSDAQAAVVRLRDAMVEDLKRGDYGASVDSSLPKV